MDRIISDEGIQFRNNDKEIAFCRETIGENGILVELSGKFSAETANDIFDEMNSLILSGQSITVSLQKTEYMAPSIMDVLLRIEQKLEQKGKTLQIIQTPLLLYQEFRKRGLSELLDIEVEKKA